MDTDRPPDIVVVAGGAVVSADLVAEVPSTATVIAADAGVAAALDHGWRVDLAVGDFDSLDPGLVARLDSVAGEVQRHPVDKDATDLDLALGAAVALAVPRGRVLVVGIEGGRPDHALANLLLLASDRFASVEIEAVLDHGRAWVVHDQLTGTCPAGSLLSVLPVHGSATVSITGVAWPLASQHLAPGTTHGVSNRADGGPFRLEVHDGTVLCISPRTPDEESP